MKLFIIDLMNLAFRSFYGIGAQHKLANSSGKLTYMAYGMAQSISRLQDLFSPDYMIVTTDSRGKNFRHAIYDGYKSNRKPAPDEFVMQLPDLFRMLEAYGLNVVKHPATEADDVIGTLSTKYADLGFEVYIVSSDKDFMQLIGPKVKMCKPVRGGDYEIVSEQGVYDKFACTPKQVIDCLAMMGDAVDAVPGVKGIGEKGAAKLIKSFGSLEGVYENLEKIAPTMSKKLAVNKEMAFISKDLVTIRTDIPVEIDIESCKWGVDNMFRTELKNFFIEMEFASMLIQDSGLVIDQPDFSHIIQDELL